jgi:integration host factor subunit alpha
MILKIYGKILTSPGCGEDVLISGFGKFCMKEKQERRGRNPQTGEPIMLASRNAVTFKCTSVLRDRINGKV